MSRPENYCGTCPHCSCMFEAILFSSHYIDNVRLWSDGYQNSRILNNSGSDNWRVCPKCSRLMHLTQINLDIVPESKPSHPSLFKELRSFWQLVTSANKSHTPTYTYTPKLGFAISCSVLAIQRELDGNPQQRKRERLLRLLAWHLINHTSAPKELPSGWEDGNKVRLLSLLAAKSINRRIMRVELLRQMGRFDEALVEIKNIPDKCTNDEYFAIIQLVTACVQKRSEVFELNKLSDK